MGEPVARIGDESSHGGHIITGADRTLANGKPVARKGDLHSCPEHGVSAIVTGSEKVLIEGQSAARVGDRIGCGAVIISGSPDTKVG